MKEAYENARLEKFFFSPKTDPNTQEVPKVPFIDRVNEAIAGQNNERPEDPYTLLKEAAKPSSNEKTSNAEIMRFEWSSDNPMLK